MQSATEKKPGAKESKTELIVPAVDRAIQVLTSFTSGSEELGVTDLASTLHLHKSTVHNIVRTLHRHGFLEQNPSTKRYKLGHRIVEIAALVVQSTDLRLISRPLLRQLMETTKETIFLVVLQGTSLVLIEKEESLQPMKITSPIGRRIPVTAGAAGRVFLAWLSDSARDRLIESQGLPQFTAKSTTQVRDLKNQLAQVRQMGYAVETDEFVEGVSEVAAPVFNAFNDVVAALVVVGLTGSMSGDRMPAIIEQTTSCARRLSSLLGNPSRGVLPTE